MDSASSSLSRGVNQARRSAGLFSASATAGVERSVTTTDSASATLRVKPRNWAYCKRGVYVYSIRGVMRRTFCSGPHCHHTRSFTAQAPSRDAFIVGPGRG